MISFPNAKINLGLNIVRKRPDGYHDLETLFYPVDYRDVLEIIPSKDMSNLAPGVSLHLTGKPVQGPAASNICVKAWHLLKADHPSLPPVELHLMKVIPMGAGLGGGSADGSFTLKMLNEKFELGISDQALESYALALGSDCPFFIRNTPCFATGRGEQMHDFPLDLSAYSLLLVHPGIHVSTAQAFSGVVPSVPGLSITDIVSEDISTWRGRLVNDFERTVFPQFQAIRQIRDLLYEHGAIYASMTGSGSSVFGIYPGGKLPDLSFPSDHSVFRQESMRPTI
jgi:4-diphosphocytidyl-2-C-methyl-D-erythritol kinase